jgi:hypothetical protein
MNNTLIIYCYYEKNEEYKNNLIYFLNNGLENNNDYIFVINGQTTINIPKYDNINIIKRENIGYDFSAYGEALKNINLDKYKYFFFINTSVKGPFIPNYINISWTEPFKNLLKNDVKLVGTTINLTENFEYGEKYLSIKKKYYVHVQSQFFVTDLECLKFLISKGIFNLFTENNFIKLIALREIGMSQHVLNNNWNISCILQEYQNIDYRTLNIDFNPTSTNGEMNYKNRYFNRTLHPYEAIFIKTNRDLLNNQIQSISNNNLNRKLNTIIFLLYFNNDNISQYINHIYFYPVKITNYNDIYDFLLNNQFLLINKDNIGIILFNDINNINFFKYVNNYDLIIVNNKHYDKYNNNLLNYCSNVTNLNIDKKHNDFTSYITKKHYLINFINIYNKLTSQMQDNVILIKMLSIYFGNLNIKTFQYNDNSIFYKK